MLTFPQSLLEYPFLLTLAGGALAGSSAYMLRRAAPALTLALWPWTWLLSAMGTFSVGMSFLWAWSWEQAEFRSWRPLTTFFGIVILLAGLALFLWGLSALKGAALFPRITDPVIREGPYAHLTRPMAVGGMLLGLGFSLIVSTKAGWLCYGAWLLISQMLLELEEWELRSRNKDAWKYLQGTPRYLPRKFRPQTG